MGGRDANNFDSTKYEEALKREVALAATMPQIYKIKMVDRVRSSIVMCLRNKHHVGLGVFTVMCPYMNNKKLVIVA